MKRVGLLLKIVNAYKNPPVTEGASNSQLMTDDILVATDRLESIVERIYNESGRIEKVSDNVLSMSETIVKNQTEALDGVEALTHFLQTVQHRAEESSAQAKVMRETNGSLEEDLNYATNALTHTSDTFANLTENTLQTSQSIHFLLDQMQYITEFQQMLKNMVEQTNMLAMNASIEASHAGAHGRTFAVVAGRIKELADSGKRNLQEIDVLLQSIQSASQEVLAVMEKNQELITANKQELEDSHRYLGQVQGRFDVLEQIISENETTCLKQVETVQNMTGQLAHLLSKSKESNQLAADVRTISASQNGIVKQLLEASKHLTSISDEFSEAVKQHSDTAEIVDNPQFTIDTFAQWKSKMEHWAAGHGELMQSSPDELQTIFQTWIGDTDALEAVWLNNADGDFLHSLPPAGILNAKRRPWFTGALQDGFYISAPYLSAITKRPCVTISIYMTDKDGHPGVLGVDISVQ
jgi:methyl-accepting chemotaxis protein